MPPLAVKTEIARALELTSVHGCLLVINDYWREAIDLAADFVHLGQGDLVGADIAAIKAAESSRTAAAIAISAAFLARVSARATSRAAARAASPTPCM